MTTHSAPQLAYPLVRSALLGVLLLLVWVAGAVSVGYWFYGLSGFSWRVYVAVAIVVLAGLSAAHGWLRSPAGQLSWDGQLWRWQSVNYTSGGAALALTVALDLRSVLWLRLENSDGAALWLWAERSALPYRWLDFRRAVYSNAGSGAGIEALRPPVGEAL